MRNPVLFASIMQMRDPIWPPLAAILKKKFDALVILIKVYHLSTSNLVFSRPVGTNLVLVRRIRANVTIHESGASEANWASNGVGSRGPRKLSGFNI